MAVTGTKAVPPLSEKLEQIQIKLESLGADSELHSTRAELARTKGSEAGAEMRQEYSAKKNQLRLKENDLEFEALERRRLAATTAGSPLNYADRMVEVQEMFDVDFAAAKARGPLLAEGMNNLFNAGVRFPKLGNHGALSDLVTWTREIAEHQQNLLESAVSTGLAISIRQSLSPADWTEFSKGNATVARVEAPEGFREAKWCLIRSARVEILGQFERQVLGLSIDVPSTAYEPKDFRVSTSDVFPNDRFGITGNINARSLQNRSPFGDWKFQVSNLSGADSLEDVVIRLKVAVIR